MKVREQRDMRDHYTMPLTFQYIRKLSYNIIGGNSPAVGIFNITQYLSCHVSMWEVCELIMKHQQLKISQSSGKHPISAAITSADTHSPPPSLQGEMFRRLTF